MGIPHLQGSPAGSARHGADRIVVTSPVGAPAPAKGAAVAHGRESPRTSAAPWSDLPTADFRTMASKQKILLVDDDKGLLRLLSIRLKSAGYEVDTATSGEQALGRLPGWQPQLIITDLRMDGMGGMAHPH